MKTNVFVLGCCLSTGWLAHVASGQPPGQRESQAHPNILFIVMDDVGIDQLRSFGYGGLTPPSTPSLDAVAKAGVRFRNVWAMPECSPSRAMFFEGRYPFRTNVLSPILSTDLANSHVSPFEVTTPKVLKQAGYSSGLFGKYHLGGPDNNPFGSAAPASLGFDYFYGFLEGAPHPIDSTAGGIVVTQTGKVPTGPYSCGFVPNKLADPANGADIGACYFTGGRSCADLDQPLDADAWPDMPGTGRRLRPEWSLSVDAAIQCEFRPDQRLLCLAGRG
jgi:hypothetical protein